MESSVEREYHSKSHSKFLVKFHIIFVCKYRKKVLAYNRIDDDMKQVLFDISNGSDFWTDGYFISSVGNASQETIKHYIESQG